MREKLIELLECTYGQVDDRDYDCYGECKTCQAENLIANGVGFLPKWIPVTERLPDLELVEAQANDEEIYKCLVTMKHRPSRGGKCVREMWYDGEGFVDRDYIDWTELVTHWMPLPEAPKGESK